MDALLLTRKETSKFGTHKQASGMCVLAYYLIPWVYARGMHPSPEGGQVVIRIIAYRGTPMGRGTWVTLVK